MRSPDRSVPRAVAPVEPSRFPSTPEEPGLDLKMFLAGDDLMLADGRVAAAKREDAQARAECNWIEYDDEQFCRVIDAEWRLADAVRKRDECRRELKALERLEAFTRRQPPPEPAAVPAPASTLRLRAFVLARPRHRSRHRRPAAVRAGPGDDDGGGDPEHHHVVTGRRRRPSTRRAP